jgi:hypothetical protein
MRYFAVDDPWNPQIAEFVAGKEHVSIGEIMTTLDVSPKSKSQTQFMQNRVVRWLMHAGWRKHRATVDGKREYRYFNYAAGGEGRLKVTYEWKQRPSSDIDSSSCSPGAPISHSEKS